MSASVSDIAALRERRDLAKAAFDERYGAIKADMEERGLAGRIIDENLGYARAVFDETVAVIEDNPAVIGGTIAALVLWLLRNPIFASIQALLGSGSEEDKELDNG